MLGTPLNESLCVNGVMEVELENVESELTKEFEGFDELVGVYSGDLYISQRSFGYFVASIYPESKLPLVMLVSAINTEKNTIATIGVSCKVGAPDALLPVVPSSLPWGDEDGVLFCNHISPEDYESYSIATQLFKAAKCIINKESDLFGYVQGEST